MQRSTFLNVFVILGLVVNECSSLNLRGQVSNDEQERGLGSSGPYCGCSACTEEIWNRPANPGSIGATCGSRIEWVNGGDDSAAGCTQVAGVEFRDGECGPYCDPARCDRVDTATRCGCPECTIDLLYSTMLTDDDGTFSCGDRIDWLMNNPPFVDESAACLAVARDEFSDSACGQKCNPETCNQPPTTYCGCSTCTQAVWDTVAGNDPAFTCGSRITEYGCELVSRQTFPEGMVCAPCDPITCPSSSPVVGGTTTPAPVPPTPSPTSSPFPPAPFPSAAPINQAPPTTASHCGCYECTDDVWNADAQGATCAERITWVMNNTPRNEVEACELVAGGEFVDICGPKCDPRRCDGKSLPPITPGPTPAPKMWFDSATSPLYCFPPADSRTKWTNGWGKGMILEAKEAGFKCGPNGDKPNWWSKDTVTVADDELTMEFKEVNGQWTASEVRVLLPAGGVYSYGTYSFSVSTVEVLDSAGTVQDNILPKNMILGLFTWDPSEDFSFRENFNHEVDVEISRWSDASAPDVNFLLQPPGYPQYKKQYSGPNDTYNQQNHVYSFTWLPNQVYWNCSSCGSNGLTHEYSTRFAIENGVTDFVQCMPANVEVRINLWNQDGDQAPDGVASGGKVKVVIDDFSYTASSVTHAAEDDFCSKHCQCAQGAECIQGRCETI